MKKVINKMKKVIKIWWKKVLEVMKKIFDEKIKCFKINIYKS